jgi:hypothetical protein
MDTNRVVLNTVSLGLNNADMRVPSPRRRRTDGGGSRVEKVKVWSAEDAGWKYPGNRGGWPVFVRLGHISNIDGGMTTTTMKLNCVLP